MAQVEGATPAAENRAASDAPPAADVGEGHAAPDAPAAPIAPPKRERIRIHNSCSKQVNLRIERENDSDTNTMLTSNTGMEERAKDGDEVRLLDDKYAVVHVLKIEPSMKEVDIASNCREVQGK